MLGQQWLVLMPHLPLHWSELACGDEVVVDGLFEAEIKLCPISLLVIEPEISFVSILFSPFWIPCEENTFKINFQDRRPYNESTKFLTKETNT